MTGEGSGKIVDIASVPSQIAPKTIARSSATKGGLAMLTTGTAAVVRPPLGNRVPPQTGAIR